MAVDAIRVTTIVICIPGNSGGITKNTVRGRFEILSTKKDV
jgi:hypothetical protein